MRNARSLSLVPFLVCLLGCTGLPSVEAPAPSLPGRYEDLTQQEWTLALELAGDGSALLEYTWWDASSGEAKLRRKRASWKRRRSGIVLRYDGVVDTLGWKSRLRDENGKNRGRGFVSLEPVDPRSIIGGSRLWHVGESEN